MDPKAMRAYQNRMMQLRNMGAQAPSSKMGYTPTVGDLMSAAAMAGGKTAGKAAGWGALLLDPQETNSQAQEEAALEQLLKDKQSQSIDKIRAMQAQQSGPDLSALLDRFNQMEAEKAMMPKAPQMPMAAPKQAPAPMMPAPRPMAPQMPKAAMPMPPKKMTLEEMRKRRYQMESDQDQRLLMQKEQMLKQANEQLLRDAVKGLPKK